MKWLASPQGFKLDRQEDWVFLSAIFKWYGKDSIANYNIEQKFAGNEREKAVLNFISQYLSDMDLQYLERGNYQVKHSNYDWALNEQN